MLQLKVHTKAKAWADEVVRVHYIENKPNHDCPADKEMQRAGWIGEYMIRELFGVPHPKPTEVGPDGGVDLTLKGYTIDVKTQRTQYPYGAGSNEWGSNFRSDQLTTDTDMVLFAHLWEPMDVLFVPGWIWKKSLYNPAIGLSMSKGDKRGEMVARNNMKFVLDSNLTRVENHNFHNTDAII